MKILSFDTTGQNLTVALSENDQIISQNIITESSKQSELLIPQIEDILKNNKIHYQNLDLIACSKGPGSFTGSRIGLTVARTLKLAMNLPLILLDSCEIIASKYNQEQLPIVVLIDARGHEFFYAKFLDNVTIDQSQLVKLEDLATILPEQNFLLCGSGKKIAAKILAQAKRPFKITNDEDDSHAALICKLAYHKFNVEKQDSQNLDPLYLRQPRISQRKK